MKKFIRTLYHIFGRRIVEVKVSQPMVVDPDKRYVLIINGPIPKAEFNQLVADLKEQGIHNVYIQTVPYAFRVFETKEKKKVVV